MDDLDTRLDALEQQLQTLTHHTHTVTRRLRWWRGLAGSLLVLALLTWALPTGMAQEEASTGGQKGLAQRVAALEQLLQHFSREGNEVFITGANLHLVNGLGSTDCTDDQFEPIPDCPNGLGNLIVGYNEPRSEKAPVFGENIRTGSHNLVVGEGDNFSRFGGIVVGNFNTISGDFATVSGGIFNTASGAFAWVGGGQENTANGLAAAVSGGAGNTASAVDEVYSLGASSVGGGRGNTASGLFSSVSGGLNRTAAGEFDWIAGDLFEDE